MTASETMNRMTPSDSFVGPCSGSWASSGWAVEPPLRALAVALTISTYSFQRHWWGLASLRSLLAERAQMARPSSGRSAARNVTGPPASERSVRHVVGRSASVRKVGSRSFQHSLDRADEVVGGGVLAFQVGADLLLGVDE